MAVPVFLQVVRHPLRVLPAHHAGDSQKRSVDESEKLKEEICHHGDGADHDDPNEYQATEVRRLRSTSRPASIVAMVAGRWSVITGPAFEIARLVAQDSLTPRRGLGQRGHAGLRERLERQRFHYSSGSKWPIAIRAREIRRCCRHKPLHTVIFVADE